MTEERFEAFGTWCRSPGTRKDLANCSFFSVDDERLVGATYYIRQVDAFGYVLLARDAHGRFQAFANFGPHWSLRGAEAALMARLSDLEGKPTPDIPMRQDTRAGVDLFAPVGKARLNPKFVNLRDGRNPSAAREYLREMGRWVVDLDGNLVKDFQTTGFDSRTWELYLFAVFTSLDFATDRSDAVPDFRLTKGETKVFVEAVTANATGNVEFDITKPPPDRPENFWQYIENEMPQKFGSPLRSKLKKRYWERSDVSGHPFVIAIADFHSPGSMIWSHTAIPLYLYGIGVDVHYGKDGTKRGVEKKVSGHVVGSKVVPSNFFGQADTRHVSAVLFSNAGTMAKFNRMGVLAGFGDPEVKLRRKGGFNNPSPGAFDEIPFEMNIEDPDYRERWADEIEIYHNPNALVPLPEEVFAGTAQFFLEQGEYVWRGPSPRVLYSSTMSLAVKE